MVTTGTSDYARAVDQLASYLAVWRKPRLVGGAGFTVKDAITYYLSAKHKEKKTVNEFDFVQIIENLGHFPADAISPEICRDFFESQSKQRSAGTIKKALTMLRAALNYCHKNGKIENKANVWMPAAGKPREYFLSVDDIQKVFDKLPAFHYKLFVHIAVATGARRSAILDLKISDFDGKTLDMRPPSQTNKRRGIVPVIEGSTFQAVLLKAQRQSRSGYFIENLRGKPMAGQSILNAIKKAGQDAGIEHPVTPHVLKHTAIVLMAKAGVPLEDIADYTATSLNTLYKNYLHHTPERGMRAASALQNVI